MTWGKAFFFLSWPSLLFVFQVWYFVLCVRLIDMLSVSTETDLYRISEVSLPTDIIEPFSASVRALVSSAHAFFPKQMNKYLRLWGKHQVFSVKGALNINLAAVSQMWRSSSVCPVEPERVSVINRCTHLIGEDMQNITWVHNTK